MAITVGLVNLDPISGLINYVTDIKPYHTKIFETLVEYVYTDSVAVTITDSEQWTIVSAPVDADDITITEFVETLAFGWDSNYTYAIDGMTATNEILVSGNIATVTKQYDFVTITGASSDNGGYQVACVTFDPNYTDVSHTTPTPQTIITLTPTPTSTITSGTLTVQDIDVPYWFQFSVISVDPILAEETLYTAPITPIPLASLAWSSTDGIAPNILSTAHYAANANTQKIILEGNATTAIQVGAEFELIGTTFNVDGITSDNTHITSDNTHITCDNLGSIFSSDGIYHAITVRYDPIQNITTIGVGPGILNPSPFSIVSASEGGFARPYRYIGEQTGSFDQPYESLNFDMDQAMCEIITASSPTPPIAWTARTPLPQTITAMAYGNGSVFASIANSGVDAQIYASTDDGVNFSSLAPVTNSNSIAVNALGYGNGVWLAGLLPNAPDQIRRSVDGGLTWSTPTVIGSLTGISSMDTDGAGNWMAVGLYVGTNNYATSNDNGITWTSGNPVSVFFWISVIWDGTQFVGTFLDNSFNEHIATWDGTNWNDTIIPGSFSSSIGIGFANGLYCLGLGLDLVITASTPAGLASATPISTGLSDGGNALIIGGGGLLIAFGVSGGVSSSTDGITWVPGNLNFQVGDVCNYAAYDPTNNVFIAGGVNLASVSTYP